MEIFLRSHCNYEVRRVLDECHFETLIHEIERENVDVVIINPGEQLLGPQLPLQLIEMYPGIKVIALDLKDSSVDVYNRQKVFMKHVSDLLDLVG